MPFALVTIGLLMIIVGAKGTHKAFGADVAQDFTGPNNFTYWLAALGAVGMLGYIENFRAFSRAFMALIIVAMLLSNEGFFAKFSEALARGPEKPPEGETGDGDTASIQPSAALGGIVQQSTISQGVTLATLSQQNSDRIAGAGNTAMNIAKMFI